MNSSNLPTCVFKSIRCIICNLSVNLNGGSAQYGAGRHGADQRTTGEASGWRRRRFKGRGRLGRSGRNRHGVIDGVAREFRQSGENSALGVALEVADSGHATVVLLQEITPI